ncbi:MAG: glycoside hydrolase family 3 C-terminal domain-containing protein [Erysipelotrichaceae bacterium]|nr:glycoside hydrolase family 3 C-terminal domain-containing protein [Erysipelotrichaceae bacterium]
MKKYQIFGARTPEESQRERDHRILARKAAAEGFVLLKNDGVLPLDTGKIALYGPGSRKTVKGGSGSGDVRERYSVTIEEGLKNAGFTFPTTLWMDRFEKKYENDIEKWRSDVEEAIKGYGPLKTMEMFIRIGDFPKPYPSCTPILSDELTDETDTVIYVLARQAGEGADRRVEKGDYLLSDIETESLKLLSEHYKKLILVLNCGSVIDLSVLDEIRIDAVIFYGQGGTEGGNALADVLTGKVTPSGKLTDTWAVRYEEYPGYDSFGHRNGDLDNDEYKEGVYVGYRWFEKNDIKPRFPFGFGLSYTDFKISVSDISDSEVTVTVTNNGKRSGKEIILLYIAKPEGKLDHEKRVLAAFCKTKELLPGESETLVLLFEKRYIASFDQENNAYTLERGKYSIIINDRTYGNFTLNENLYWPIIKNTHEDKHSHHVMDMLGRLTDEDKCLLVTGGGYPVRAYNQVMGSAGRTCTTLLKKGIPNIVLSDGPAGLNVLPETAVMKNGIPTYPNGLPEDWRWGWLRRTEGFLKRFLSKGEKIYRYMTAWPSETVLAQTWDIDLMEEVGKAIGKEMLEIGVSVWLAPGLNIHRNPLCGRNFEYYSEDPIVSGKMAAAITRGVQSMDGVGVSIKHFCCNNQEDNRMMTSANLDERTLREIYLRGFEIAVKESDPWTIMSSYNKVNGKHVVNSKELLTGIIREEWGYTGLVMSDWTSTDQCSHYEAINAGNDLIMPGRKDIVKNLENALKDGSLSKEALDRSCARVLALIFKSATCRDF